jgi:hypothetical protein
MTQFRVRWEVDVEAETAREAAEQAWSMQLDHDSIALVFEVARTDKLFNQPASWEYEKIDLMGEKVEHDDQA